MGDMGGGGNDITVCVGCAQQLAPCVVDIFADKGAVRLIYPGYIPLNVGYVVIQCAVVDEGEGRTVFFIAEFKVVAAPFVIDKLLTRIGVGVVCACSCAL